VDEDLVGPQIIRTSSLTGYGRTLTRIALRAQRLESTLRVVEWGSPSSWPGGKGMCPACDRFRDQGHAESCLIAGAFRHQDPITHAEEAIRYVRGRIRDEQAQVEILLGTVQTKMVELQSTLDDVTRILGQL
jgi:hypothetical protein